MRITKLESLCLLILVAISIPLGLHIMHRGGGQNGTQPAGSGPEMEAKPAAPASGGFEAEAGPPVRAEAQGDDLTPADGLESDEKALHIPLPSADSRPAAEAGASAEEKLARHAAPGLQGSEERIRVLDAILNQPWSPQGLKRPIGSGTSG